MWANQKRGTSYFCSKVLQCWCFALCMLFFRSALSKIVHQMPADQTYDSRIANAFEAVADIGQFKLNPSSSACDAVSSLTYSAVISPFGVVMNMMLSRLSDRPQYENLYSHDAGVDIIFYENGRYDSVRENMKSLQRCMFSGRVVDDSRSSVFLSFCSPNNFQGEIKTFNDSYHLFSSGANSPVFVVRDSDLIIDNANTNGKPVASCYNITHCDSDSFRFSRQLKNMQAKTRFIRSPTQSTSSYDAENYAAADAAAAAALHAEWRSKRDTISASPTSAFPVYEPYNFTVSTGLIVELVLVIDSSAYRYFNVSRREEAISRAVEILSLVNQLYEPLNVHFALVGVEVWIDRDPITVTENSGDSLENFVDYRRQHLVPRFPHDTAQLMSGKVFSGGVLGKALVGTVCSYMKSGGVNKVQSQRIGNVAATVAHELGHNLGMEHDNKLCDCVDRHCIMNDAISAWEVPTHWSSCAWSYLAWLKDRHADDCLHNVPVRMVNSPRCGNGWLEPGEQCDCGTAENCPGNKCCNATTCRFAVPGAQCGTGSCCDLSSCQLRTGGTVCRAAKSAACDLPEYCDGQSEHCPRDVYSGPGTPCTVFNNGGLVSPEELAAFDVAVVVSSETNAVEAADNAYYRETPRHYMNAEQQNAATVALAENSKQKQLPVLPPTRAYCYAGECLTRQAQCGRLWGSTGREASPLCYGELNMQGKATGHCRQNITTSVYEPCPSRLDAMCGLLHCQHESVKIRYGGEGVSDWRETLLRNVDNALLHCVTVHIDNGLDMQDPGMVPNGAPCGIRGERMCLHQRCIERSAQAIAGVLRGTHGFGGFSEVRECDAQKTCGGNGVCNSKGNCHCNAGYDPNNDCYSGGYGGSIDSGPSTDPHTHRAWTQALAIIFGGILPICLAILLLVLCRHRLFDSLRRWRAKGQRPAAPTAAASVAANSGAARRPAPNVPTTKATTATTAIVGRPGGATGNNSQQQKFSRSGSTGSAGSSGIRVMTNKFSENVGSLRKQAKALVPAVAARANNLSANISSTSKPSPAMSRNEILKSTARRSFGKGTLNKDIISHPVQVQSSTVRMSDIINTPSTQGGTGGSSTGSNWPSSSSSTSSAAVMKVVPSQPPPRPHVAPVAYKPKNQPQPAVNKQAAPLPSVPPPPARPVSSYLYPSQQLHAAQNATYGDDAWTQDAAARSGNLSANEVALEWPDSVSGQQQQQQSAATAGEDSSGGPRMPVRAAPPPPAITRDYVQQSRPLQSAPSTMSSTPPPPPPPNIINRQPFSTATLGSIGVHRGNRHKSPAPSMTSSTMLRRPSLTNSSLRTRPNSRPPLPPTTRSGGSGGSNTNSGGSDDIVEGVAAHIYEEVLRVLNKDADSATTHSPTADDELLPKTLGEQLNNDKKPATTVSELARKFGGRAR